MSAARPLELAVVIPTFNERANVPRLVAALDVALAGRAWEAIFVDDNSPDGTADAAREIGRTDSRIRVIQRLGRRGLSTACIEGMCATAAPCVAVIDGDMQHDEALLPRMLDALQADESLDLVVGSRFVEGGGLGEWDEDRVAKSAFATKLSKKLLKVEVTDPMSGFFMIRSVVARAITPQLSGIGFKILLDLMTASPKPLKFTELGYVFRTRIEGESKLDHVVAMEYLIAIYDRMFLGRIVPVRFAMFAAIGALGAIIHFLVLLPLIDDAGATFRAATIAATAVAMTFNFFVNNALTYRDARLKGFAALLQGWVSFCLVCAVGAIANVGVAVFLYTNHSGIAIPALAGIAVGAVWNFVLSSKFVWGRY